MKTSRFEISHGPLGFIARFVNDAYPKESWQSRPWRLHASALQSIFLLAENPIVVNPPGIPWARGVQFDPHGFVEIRETADEPPTRRPARLGRPPRTVYS